MGSEVGDVAFQPAVAIALMAVLVAAASWLSLQVAAAAAADLTVLPASCRRRLGWWRLRARATYLLCASSVFLAAVLQICHTLG